MLHSHRWFALAVPAIAVGLIAATLVPAAASASPQDPFAASAAALTTIQHSWSAVPEYAGAPALDTGRLVDPAGRAMAGATIIVFPVPKATKADQPLNPIARATTNSAGEYTLDLPYTKWPLLRGFGDFGNEGDLNLHIVAFYPGAMASWFTPIKLSTQKAATTKLVLRQLPSGHVSKSPAAVRPEAICTLESNTEYSGVPMVVGYKSTTHANDINYAQYTYTDTVSQTTGAGISATGPNGGFSAGGTTTETSGVTIPFPTIHGVSSNYMTVYSTWNEEHFSCVEPAVAGTAPSDVQFYDEWDVLLNSVNTEDGTPGAPIVAAGHCDLEGPNVAIKFTTTSQQTWSDGVSISDIIGINLSSQDGWTGSSALTYDLSASGPICGVNNFPNANNPSAGYLQVH